MKKLLPFIVYCLVHSFLILPLNAQFKIDRDPGVGFPAMKKSFLDMRRNVLELPEVPGHVLLKVDFHMHTVFSDGSVWPTTRVEEAFLEGLDAIAITDHIEYQPKKEHVRADDHNLPYEIAKKTADQLGIILIRGTEITREVPAGHFNAIFIEDANALAKMVNPADPSDQRNIKETLALAKKQGAFIFWNHPWYKQEKDQAIWYPVHEELWKAGLIMGIEVNNRDRYYPEIFRWCQEKNLTMMSTSDAHAPLFRLEPGSYRSMNILVAKERSAKGIREALDQRRALVYTQNFLYGPKEDLDLIFGHSIKHRIIHQAGSRYIVEFKNTSGIPYDIEILPGTSIRTSSSEFILDAKGNAVLILSLEEKNQPNEIVLAVKVRNLHPTPETPLLHEIKLNLK
jgi:3',5'-nucleoside bisphosphate phosphatase